MAEYMLVAMWIACLAAGRLAPKLSVIAPQQSRKVFAGPGINSQVNRLGGISFPLHGKDDLRCFPADRRPAHATV
jgi:hypothetical protein